MVHKSPTSLKYTLYAHNTNPTPKVKQENKNNIGMNCKAWKLGSNPKKNIKIKNGINDSPKFASEANKDDTGNIKFGKWIDFNTSAFATIEIRI